MRNRQWTGTFLAFLALSLSACGSSATSSHAITIHQSDMPRVAATASQSPIPGGKATDLAGKSVTVNDPTRIVSLATSVAEIISALGATNALVGRDVASQTSQLANVPVVTEGLSVSAEKVLATKPTLVIADAQTAPSEALDAIAKAGIQIISVPQAWTLDAVAPRVTAVAQALGIPHSAPEVIAQLHLKPRQQTATKVAFLYVRGTSSVYLIGGKGSGADALITAAGAHDVGAEAGMNPFTPLTPEALIKLQPDVLLVMTKGLESVNGVDGLVALPGVAQTPAGMNKRIIAVDDGLLLAFGADTGNVITALSDALSQVMKP